jgi:hypothetical protein
MHMHMIALPSAAIHGTTCAHHSKSSVQMHAPASMCQRGPQLLVVGAYSAAQPTAYAHTRRCSQHCSTHGCCVPQATWLLCASVHALPPPTAEQLSSCAPLSCTWLQAHTWAKCSAQVCVSCEAASREHVQQGVLMASTGTTHHHPQPFITSQATTTPLCLRCLACSRHGSTSLHPNS